MVQSLRMKILPSSADRWILEVDNSDMHMEFSTKKCSRCKASMSRVSSGIVILLISLYITLHVYPNVQNFKKLNLFSFLNQFNRYLEK